MPDKLKYITNDDRQNYPSGRLHLVVEMFVNSTCTPTNQNAIKDPKVFKPTNKKTLWTSVINSPMSPPSYAYLCWHNSNSKKVWLGKLERERRDD